MNLGSSVHLALEGYYGYGLDPFRVLDWEYSNTIFTHPDEEDELEKEHTLARVMMEGYLDWSSSEGIDANVDVIGTELAVEHELEVPGRDGMKVTLRGRLDQLARRKDDGSLIIRDLKTVGSLGKAQLLRISAQLKFYAMIHSLEAKDKGEVPATGGEYLLLLRSKRTDRAKPPFYSRVEVPLNRHEMNSQYLMTVSLVQEILEARDRLVAGEHHQAVAYPHFGDHCSWVCDHKNICTLMDDGSRWEDMLKANFIHQDDVLSYYSNDKINLAIAALRGT